MHAALALNVRDRQRQRPPVLHRAICYPRLRRDHHGQRPREAGRGHLERRGVRGLPAGARLRRATRTLPRVWHPLDVLSAALRPGVLPLAAAIAAAALYGWTLLSRADALLLPAYDTAFFQQVVWNIGHGRGFASDFFPASFLGLHFSPLLLLLGELVANRWLAAALAAPVPLWAALQQAAWAGFHPEALALPLVLLAGW